MGRSNDEHERKTPPLAIVSSALAYVGGALVALPAAVVATIAWSLFRSRKKLLAGLALLALVWQHLLNRRRRRGLQLLKKSVFAAVLCFAPECSAVSSWYGILTNFCVVCCRDYGICCFVENDAQTQVPRGRCGCRVRWSAGWRQTEAARSRLQNIRTRVVCWRHMAPQQIPGKWVRRPKSLLLLFVLSSSMAAQMVAPVHHPGVHAVCCRQVRPATPPMPAARSRSSIVERGEAKIHSDNCKRQHKKHSETSGKRRL